MTKAAKKQTQIADKQIGQALTNLMVAKITATPDEAPALKAAIRALIVARNMLYAEPSVREALSN